MILIETHIDYMNTLIVSMYIVGAPAALKNIARTYIQYYLMQRISVPHLVLFVELGLKHGEDISPCPNMHGRP